MSDTSWQISCFLQLQCHCITHYIADSEVSTFLKLNMLFKRELQQCCKSWCLCQACTPLGGGFFVCFSEKLLLHFYTLTYWSQNLVTCRAPQETGFETSLLSQNLWSAWVWTNITLLTSAFLYRLSTCKTSSLSLLVHMSMFLMLLSVW